MSMGATAPLRILADENITAVREYFEPYGVVTTLPGRSIDSDAVKHCDALLIRSITPVSAELLKGSSCRFVGTATSGVDHVDAQSLRDAGITFVAAEGCNSISVVDYVFSVMAASSPIAGKHWQECSVGIIGCGRIGGALAQRLLALGMIVRIYDPLLHSTHPLRHYCVELAEVLAQNIVTLHVPLTTSGAFPTMHMLEAQQLTLIPKETLLINAARGAAIDNAALVKWLTMSPQHRVVLDTWEGEPAISLQLLKQVELATPHIAGYSTEGKLKGTLMLRDQLCRYFALPVTNNTQSKSAGEVLVQNLGAQQQLDELILAAYDVRRDHHQMQQLKSSITPAADFDKLRKHYPVRREMSAYQVKRDQLAAQAAEAAAVLGFKLY